MLERRFEASRPRGWPRETSAMRLHRGAGHQRPAALQSHSRSSARHAVTVKGRSSSGPPRAARLHSTDEPFALVAPNSIGAVR